MKRQLIVLLIVVLIIFGFIGYSYFQANQSKDTLTLFGNVDVRQVDLGFRVNGRVVRMHYEEGEFVPAGKLMATLDKNPYNDQVRQAEAAVQSARISFENSQILLKRRQELISDGSVSQEDLDNALMSRDVNASNLKQAEASLGIAITNYTDTELFSPADGIILTRIREPGTVVRESDPIYTLTMITPVWIRAYVSEPELGMIYPGMLANIQTDTPNGKTYQGHIGFISPVAEFTPKTVETTQLRTDLVYRIRIYAENPDQGLRQGMPVTIKLPLKTVKE